MWLLPTPQRALDGLREALATDRELWQLAVNPLLLTVLSAAYQGPEAVEIRQVATVEERRRRLFSAYVAAMFQRHGAGRCGRAQTERWLGWLARQLQHRSLSSFYLEGLQPGWLGAHSEGGMLMIISGLLAGLLVGLATVLVGELVWGPIMGLLAGLIFALFVGLGRWGVEIVPVDRVAWFFDVLTLRNWLLIILGTGPGLGLLCTLSSAPFSVQVGGPLGGMLFGLCSALFGALLIMLLEAARAETMVVRLRPNEGIWRSGRNGVTIGLLGALLGALLVGLTAGLIDGPLVGLGVGLTIGPLIGLGVGLPYGLATFLRHYAVRLTLWRSDLLPLDLVPFLNSCAERVLLRRVGGGYIFIHRMVLEHFASLPGPPATDPARG